MKENIKLLIHGKCLLYNRSISPVCILGCSFHKLLWVKFNTWPRGYKTFFMLNSTEHGNSIAHKTNTLTKKTFLSFCELEGRSFFITTSASWKERKVFFVSIYHANAC